MKKINEQKHEKVKDINKWVKMQEIYKKNMKLCKISHKFRKIYEI